MKEKITVDNLGVLEQNKEAILKKGQYLHIEILVGRDNPLPYVNVDCKKVSPYQEGVIAIISMNAVIKELLNNADKELMLNLLKNVEYNSEVYKARDGEKDVKNQNKE